jgi:hypothetical protein
LLNVIRVGAVAAAALMGELAPKCQRWMGGLGEHFGPLDAFGLESFEEVPRMSRGEEDLALRPGAGVARFKVRFCRIVNERCPPNSTGRFARVRHKCSRQAPLGVDFEEEAMLEGDTASGAVHFEKGRREGVTYSAASSGQTLTFDSRKRGGWRLRMRRLCLPWCGGRSILGVPAIGFDLFRSALQFPLQVNGVSEETLIEK